MRVDWSAARRYCDVLGDDGVQITPAAARRAGAVGHFVLFV